MTGAELVAVAVVIAFSAVVQLASGFGFALASVPLLSIAVGPHAAVLIALALATFTNGYQALAGRGDADRPVIARLLVGAVAGLPLGLVIYRWSDDRTLGLLVGGAVLVAVAFLVRGLDLRHAGPGLDVTGGLVAGVLTTSVGTNGPPMVFVLQARHFPPERFRATITTVFFVLDIVSVVAFAAVGEYTGEILGAVAVSLPGLALGAAAGVSARRWLHPARFRRLVIAILVIAGVAAIGNALRA